MDRDVELYKIAVTAVKDAYANPMNSVGSNQWNSTVVEYDGKYIQVLAIAGSNDSWDWIANAWLASYDGIKIGAYLSANMIMTGTWGNLDWLRRKVYGTRNAYNWLKRKLGFKIHDDTTYTFRRNVNLPLLIATHSRSTAVGQYLKLKYFNPEYGSLYNDDKLICFCPVRCHREKDVHIPNSVFFIDHDDIVPKLGVLSFSHAIPDITEQLEDDHGGISIGDHLMDHMEEYVNSLVID